MRRPLRSFDSRISFFAFADIITAVSGILIFITLLLATDLGQPSPDQAARGARAEREQELEEILQEEAAVDARNARLQALLVAADTAPGVEKLTADIARLRVELNAERQRQVVLDAELARSASALQARDEVLGLTGLKTTTAETTEQATVLRAKAAAARAEMEILDQRVVVLQAKLQKLRARDGKIWLVPEKFPTSKEPVLAIVSGGGLKVEKFMHPEQGRQWESAEADSGFRARLREAKAANQYVLFLVRPSGIKLFTDLVEIARTAGFEVGYDALEENREVHFNTPPPVDEPSPPKTAPPMTADRPRTGAVNGSTAPPTAPPVVAAATTNATPAPARPAPTASAPGKKSWWQRLLEWLGLK